MSSKGKTTFSSKKEAQTASFFWFEIACDFAEQKSCKSICYFFNFEVVCNFLSHKKWSLFAFNKNFEIMRNYARFIIV